VVEAFDWSSSDPEAATLFRTLQLKDYEDGRTPKSAADAAGAAASTNPSL
jgi:hypothetical protein